MNRNDRQYVVRKRESDTFWVRSAEKWLPRESGSPCPPPRSSMSLADAESLLEAVKQHGHLDAEILPVS